MPSLAELGVCSSAQKPLGRFQSLAPQYRESFDSVPVQAQGRQIDGNAIGFMRQDEADVALGRVRRLARSVSPFIISDDA